MRRNTELLHVSLWLALAGYGMPAGAQAHTSASIGLGGDTWTPVEQAQLARTRGGFSTPAGLEISLGIERLVSINGTIVASTQFDIADLNRLGETPLRQTGAALSAVKLIQNGGENIYQGGDAARAVGGVVIQNTLNDQLIRSQTLISSTVNSASLLKTLNFQASLGDALTRAAGTR